MAIIGQQSKDLTGKVHATPFKADLLINGKGQPASTNETFRRIGPLAAVPVTEAANASEHDIDQAAFAAAAAFQTWSRTSPAYRADILLNARHKLVEATPRLTDMMMAETGATRAWCAFNVEIAGKILAEAASLAPSVDVSKLPDAMGQDLSVSFRQPAGVCLALAAWNAPVTLGIRSFAYALAWGNTVIFKTSELCPATQRALGDVMQDAGLPAGVLNILSNAPDDASHVVEALIGHPVVRRINFTGSTRVGRIIAQIAARHLKRCLLELGGKSPFIVLADADLDEAARAAAFGAFFNQGQICMSTERIIVEDAIADAFVDKLVRLAENLKAGDPAEVQPALGALISGDAGHRLTALVEEAVSRGATLHTGGVAYGPFMDATVIDHIDSSMRLYREESFGPIASVIRVRDCEEAISVANDCDYGLSGAIFSRDVERAMRVATQVETGILHINSATVADDPAMPFGGVRASGYGRIGGLSALDEFTELRWITATGTSRRYPL